MKVVPALAMMLLSSFALADMAGKYKYAAEGFKGSMSVTKGEVVIETETRGSNPYHCLFEGKVVLFEKDAVVATPNDPYVPGRVIIKTAGANKVNVTPSADVHQQDFCGVQGDFAGAYVKAK